LWVNVINTRLPTKRSAIGHYGLFSYQDKAYLTACINPRGGTTFTKEQFSDQRNTSMMQFDRILLWLIGKEDLRDWRCLWVNMSTPVQQSNPQAAYVILQDTWKDWYSWWSPRWP
jgi:cyanosortase A-associated protein